MAILVQVALGGAIGAVMRYGFVAQASRAFGAGFPYGTLAVNVLGSLVMGVLAALVLARPGGSVAALSPLLMTGILGGFTTFSAFSLDAMNLLQRGEWGLGVAYMLGSVVLSVLALALGLGLVRGVMS